MSVDKETRALYQSQAEVYVNISMPPELDVALDRFLAAVVPGGHILDFGCGPGAQGAQMIARGFDVSGIDATPKFIEMAKENGLNARLGTFDDLTETATYDGIWASFSLLHAPRAKFLGHLTACHRALKPNGALCLAMKEGTGEHRDRLGRLYSYHSKDEIELALEEAGFSGIQTLRGQIEGMAGGIEPFLLSHARA